MKHKLECLAVGLFVSLLISLLLEFTSWLLKISPYAIPSYLFYAICIYKISKETGYFNDETRKFK